MVPIEKWVEWGEWAPKIPGWRYMPGMKMQYADSGHWYRLTEADCLDGTVPDEIQSGGTVIAWPDFRDPPTKGWLRHFVEEAWGGPRNFWTRPYWSQCGDEIWEAYTGKRGCGAAFHEVEVMLAAWERRYATQVPLRTRSRR